MNTFDYIIVGGGSAGCTLASRLSEKSGLNICLIEAGNDGKGLLLRAPIGAAAMISGRPKINNWAFETKPQAQLNDRKGFQPRGKTLGGSSAINAMLYVRGHPSDYDNWEQSGNPGWGWKDVLPYFKRAENNERGSDEFHGSSGPLQVSNQRALRPVSAAFIEAAQQCQIKYNPDFNGEDQEGVGAYQVTQFGEGPKNGERCSAAHAYLHPAMNRPNLQVITRAHVTRILMEGKKAVGVEYISGGKTEKIQTEREVILCGGTFNSPQLLLLSGIGPSQELASHGIQKAHELPGVGKNLQDHLDFVHIHRSKSPDMVGIGLRGTFKLISEIFKWRKTGNSMIASPFAEAGAFIKTDPKLTRPDIQLHFVIAMVDDHARKLHLGYGYSCHVCVLRPKSRGCVSLHDAGPLSPPRIDPNFLDAESDRKTLLKGAWLSRRILQAPALAPYFKNEMYTENVSTDEEMMTHIRARADTIYHPVGTCKMGNDPLAVVDAELKVHGIEGLRVVDASVMPTLIGGNTNAPTIMIAEKASDMILNQTP